MIAFVLSGGGPRGALQAGALQVLLERGIRPDLLVGTSAGAINAAYLGIDPTPGGAQHLGELWQRLTKEHVYPGGILRAAWNLLSRRNSLYGNESLKAFLQAHAPAHTRLLRELAVRVYVVATDLLSGRPYVFGDSPDDPLIDALMASAAIPPAFPPWSYAGRLLVDGGVAANLPLGVAIDKGATEIYALETKMDETPRQRRPSIVDVATWSIDALLRQQGERDLLLCAAHPEVTFHHLLLAPSQRLGGDDFSRATTLIAEGRAAANIYLEANQRRAGAHGWQEQVQRVRRRLSTSLAGKVRKSG